LVSAGAVSAGEWRAPTDTDSRSPCPGLNTLANHDVLPRNGLNITQPMLVDVFINFLNFEEALFVLLPRLISCKVNKLP
jgi:hypothetical protein